MSPLSRTTLGSAIAATALSVSLMAPASFAASGPVAQAKSLANPAPVIAELGNCSHEAPCVVMRTADGYILDFGSPSIYFERVDE